MEGAKAVGSIKVVKPGTLTCILCRGVVQYKAGSKARLPVFFLTQFVETNFDPLILTQIREAHGE